MIMTICPQTRSLWENWAGFSSIPKQGDFPCCQLRRENPAKGDHCGHCYDNHYYHHYYNRCPGEVSDEHVPRQCSQSPLSIGSNASTEERLLPSPQSLSLFLYFTFTFLNFYFCQVGPAQWPLTCSPPQTHPITWGKYEPSYLSFFCQFNIVWGF